MPDDIIEHCIYEVESEDMAALHRLFSLIEEEGDELSKRFAWLGLRMMDRCNVAKKPKKTHKRAKKA